jgi:hypothetical protein
VLAEEVSGCFHGRFPNGWETILQHTSKISVAILTAVAAIVVVAGDGEKNVSFIFLYVTGFFPYTDPGQKWLHRRKRQRMCKLNTFLRYMQCVYVHIYIYR